MLPQIKFSKTAAFKLLMGVIVAAALVVIFAFDNAQSQIQDKKSTDKQAKTVVKDQQKSTQTEDVVFSDPLEEPTFQGGDFTKFRDWIIKNLIYPTTAKKKGIAGKVYVQFTVNSSGEVVDVKVVRSVDPSLDEEAVRVIKSSPKWEPAKYNGNKVKRQFTTPITFVNDEQKSLQTEEPLFSDPEQPSFQGGDFTKFKKWVQDNLKYPINAKENGISGKVYVQYTINSNGEVVNVKVVRGAEPSLDAEAVRVVSSSPKWEPAKDHGIKVKTQWTIPITFSLK